MSACIETVRQVTRQFCQEFIANPYLCYTEHGLHALFYTMLYNTLPVDLRYTVWQGHKVCVIQKEYPTAERLGASQRQHWDIAVIGTPPESVLTDTALSYDYLRLAAAIEFGLNETEEHLKGDIERLCHPKANIDQGFIIHLYRLSEPGAKVSGRDWSANSRILTTERVASMTEGKPIEILYGLHDSTGRHKPGLWLIDRGTVVPLK